MGAKRGALVALGLLAYAVASVVLFHDLVRHPGSHAPIGGRSDPGQMMWYLDWTANCVRHLDNPFITHAIYAPHGTNLMWNTPMFLLGLVLTPVTLLAGPVVSFNLAVMAAPALTAATGWWWLSRHVERQVCSWFAGLLIGFGPVQAAQMGGHLNISFLPLVPVILLLSEDVLWRRPDQRGRRAVLLGLVVAGQLLLWQEGLLLVGFAMVLTALVALAVRPRLVVATVRSSWRGVLVALAVFLAVAAVPLGVQLFGPLRAAGVSYPFFATTFADLVRPTTRMLVHPYAADPTFDDGRLTSIYEAGAYLGVVLLAVLVAGTVLLRRRWEVWVAVVVATVCFLFSRGPGVDGTEPGWRLPAGPLHHLPLMEALVAPRFAIPVTLCAAFLLALTLDRLLPRRGEPTSRGRVVVTALVAAAVAVSLTPRPVLGAAPVIVPAYFRDDGPEGVGGIDDGDILLLLPTPTPENAYAAMMWAAVADDPVRMVDGYAYVTLDGQLHIISPYDPVTNYGSRLVAGGPAPSDKEAGEILGWLHEHQVDQVLVVRSEDPGHGSGRVARIVMGDPVAVSGGVARWVVPDEVGG